MTMRPGSTCWALSTVFQETSGWRWRPTTGRCSSLPVTSPITFNRATIRRFLGQLAAAEDDYDHVIAGRPNDYEAYKNRSDLRKQTRERNHVVELERVLARGIADWRGEVQIRYALAKELEDLGEYERSWSFLDAAARLRRRHLKYDIDRDVETVDWIIDAFSDSPKPLQGFPSKEPIFIVGLPRSGTDTGGTHPRKSLVCLLGR